MDVRLKKATFEHGGKTWELCCNMNVLADVQEAFGGDINEALRGNGTVRSTMEFLAAMMNDCADTNGWPERYTAKQLGRELAPGELGNIKGIVYPLVIAALSSEEDSEKNGTTTQS